MHSRRNKMTKEIDLSQIKNWSVWIESFAAYDLEIQRRRWSWE